PRADTDLEDSAFRRTKHACTIGHELLVAHCKIAEPRQNDVTIEAHHSHFAAINGLISLGSAKITSARSPIIPAATKAGALFSGPSLLASVFNRRFRSQNLCVSPFEVVTV